MSDEAKASWTKAAPQLLGIAAFAILFVICLGDSRLVESPLRQAAHRLKTGMSWQEANVVTRELGVPSGLMGSLGHTLCTWIDEERGEQLRLHFKKEGKPSRSNAIDRLTEWSVESYRPDLITHVPK
ncbi:MAG TPA: hypothetical protein VEI07_04375 [Planctomycetaceae bacterium]|nr:hypothetical protein [Planctomycetaceae bacterium]